MPCESKGETEPHMLNARFHAESQVYFLSYLKAK